MDGKRFIANVKGIGIKGAVREFYMSAKSDELTGGSWSTEPPTLGNNKYLWYRDKFTLSNGTVATTTPICDGAWEAIYNIYEINDNVSEYKKDVEALKGLDFFTKIEPPDEDTPEAWAKVGDGWCFFDGVDMGLEDRGVLFNTGTENLSHQVQFWIGANLGLYNGGWNTLIRIVTSNGSWGEWSPVNGQEQSIWDSLTPTKGTWSFLRYRKIGKKVIVEGWASAYQWSGSLGDTFAQLPATLRPVSNKYCYLQCRGMRTGRLYVDSNGNVGIDWIVTLKDGAAYTSATWLYFYIEYYCDDNA